MKKEYIIPSLQIIKTLSTTILAGSPQFGYGEATSGDAKVSPDFIEEEEY